jgi:hypothetical protein
LKLGISQKGLDLAVSHGNDGIVRLARRRYLAKVFEGNVASGSNDLLKPSKIDIVEQVTLRVTHKPSLPHI